MDPTTWESGKPIQSEASYATSRVVNAIYDEDNGDSESKKERPLEVSMHRPLNACCTHFITCSIDALADICRTCLA